MRSGAKLVVVLPVLLAQPAFADPGHMAEAGGHSHWVALAAVGAAALIGVAGLVRARARRHAAAIGETR